MPNNILLTPQILTRLVLMNLGGYLSVCRNMTKQYAKEFAKEGAKVGDTVSVKKPQRFNVTRGLAFQPQALTNIKTSITVNDVSGVHYDWDSVEKTLSLEDAQKMYGKPAAIALAHDVNSRAAQYVAQNTFNAVGTPGTTPTLLDTYLLAGDKLVQLGLPPEEDLTCIINRKMSSQFVIGQKTLYNPAGKIGRNYDNGAIESNDMLLGYRWERDQTIYTQTYGAQGGTPLINGAGQTTGNGNNDTMTLSIRGWSNNTQVFNGGEKFSVPGYYSVHPQTKASTGDPIQFTVLAPATSNGSGIAGVLVAPGITPVAAGAQYANITSAIPDGAAISVLGAANAVSPQGLLLHENAYAFVSLPLSTPKKGVIESYQEMDDETGLNLAFVQFFDGVNRVEGTRFDMLDGFGTLYREMACVISA